MNNDVTKIVQIDDNGRFKLDFSVVSYRTFEIVPGTYTLIATVGTYSEGKFKPEAKGVNVKIKVPGKAAKNSLTVRVNTRWMPAQRRLLTLQATRTLSRIMIGC